MFKTIITDKFIKNLPTIIFLTIVDTIIANGFPICIKWEGYYLIARCMFSAFGYTHLMLNPEYIIEIFPNDFLNHIPDPLQTNLKIMFKIWPFVVISGFTYFMWRKNYFMVPGEYYIIYYLHIMLVVVFAYKAYLEKNCP